MVVASAGTVAPTQGADVAATRPLAAACLPAAPLLIDSPVRQGEPRRQPLTAHTRLLSSGQLGTHPR